VDPNIEHRTLNGEEGGRGKGKLGTDLYRRGAKNAERRSLTTKNAESAKSGEGGLAPINYIWRWEMKDGRWRKALVRVSLNEDVFG
jgi:hypothetical protein